MQNDIINILLIEDNPGDVLLTEVAFEEAEIKYKMNIAEDGEEAIDALNKLTPDLILLDLNIPKIDGKEILSQIKSNHSLKDIPVIVLSSSRTSADIKSVYELQASSFERI